MTVIFCIAVNLCQKKAGLAHRKYIGQMESLEISAV